VSTNDPAVTRDPQEFIMPSYYVILFSPRKRTITFPIKAVLNEYDGKTQFAGGYPALFGGNSENRTVTDTLIKETTEESRDTWRVKPPFKQYYQGRAPFEHLYFYMSESFAETDVPWGPPRNHFEGEMSGVVTIKLNNFTNHDSPAEVLRKLINLSGASGGSPQQEKEFLTSQTAEAFIEFIYSEVPPDVEEPATGV
jgi:hypothetical protein